MNDDQVDRIVRAIHNITTCVWFGVACLYFLTISSCAHR